MKAFIAGITYRSHREHFGVDKRFGGDRSRITKLLPCQESGHHGPVGARCGANRLQRAAGHALDNDMLASLRAERLTAVVLPADGQYLGDWQQAPRWRVTDGFAIER